MDGTESGDQFRLERNRPMTTAVQPPREIKGYPLPNGAIRGSRKVFTIDLPRGAFILGLTPISDGQMDVLFDPSEPMEQRHFALYNPGQKVPPDIDRSFTLRASMAWGPFPIPLYLFEFTP
jgi:hypothetical protein